MATPWENDRGDRGKPCYIDPMVTKALKNILDRIGTWPENAQNEAAATLQVIEQEFLAPHTVTDEDRAALERSAEDVTQGRFATDEDVQRVFGRFRRA